MPLYRDSTTNVVVDLPLNIGDHPVLGAHLELYVADPECFEEDKVVVEAPVSAQRLQRTATPTAPKGKH